MTLYEILTDPNTGLGLPCAYSHFGKGDNVPEEPPFIVYMGNGQGNFRADNTYYHSENQYRLEYYFTEKDETMEARIEALLLENGYLYDKSEDVYIEDEGVFVIYYTI